MGLNLITTKLMAPRPSGSVVERPRLLKLLQTGFETKLVLISAPAGSGKSTLVASWLRQLNRPTAWLSLDAGDNDPERFLLYLVSALQQVDSRLGEGLSDFLQRSASVEVEVLITRIINDIAQHSHQLLLVLDDYHLITEEKIHKAVEFLLDHLPPGLCLLLSTRTDPPLSLSRLRVRNQLVEVRAEHLRFLSDETAAFLNLQMGLGLSNRAIQSLEERTEGWVAGLQLAALSLEGRSDKEDFIDRFAGSHHYMVDYLMDEVLQRQTPEVQRFLERTAILGRFSAGLCEAVSGQRGAQILLSQLDKANLFLIPLDQKRQWYRYHHLFAEFLRHRLTEAEPELVHKLHIRASEWLEQEDWNDEAIYHALAAKDFDRAGRLVEKVAFGLGAVMNNAGLIQYAQRLPLELLPDFPRLCLYYGWALINSGRVGALGALRVAMEQSTNRTGQIQALALLNFRAYQQVWQLDFASAVARCHEALRLLEESQQGLPSEEERSLQVYTTNLMAYCYLHSDLRQADQFYPIAFDLSKRLGIFAAMANNLSRVGLIKHQLGQLRTAFGVFERGFTLIENWRAQGRIVGAGELEVNQARLLYEWNRLDEANSHLQRAKTLIQLSQFPPVLAREIQTNAYLHAARGESEAALALLIQLEAMQGGVHPENFFYQQMFGAMAMNLRLHLASIAPGMEHLLGGVGSWLESHRIGIEDHFNYPLESNYFVLARYLLATGKIKDALILLEKLIDVAEAEGRKDDWLRYCLLKCIALQTLGEEPRALENLQATLAFAQTEGYCRSFVDFGLMMQTLLYKLAVSGEVYAQKILPAFPQLLPETQSPIPAQVATLITEKSVPTVGKTPLAGVEPLSEREQTILKLLAGGNSNKEIGKVLELSPNTVKWYLKTLFEKLGVDSRVEAINRAREGGIL